MASCVMIRLLHLIGGRRRWPLTVDSLCIRLGRSQLGLPGCGIRWLDFKLRFAWDRPYRFDCGVYAPQFPRPCELARSLEAQPLLRRRCRQRIPAPHQLRKDRWASPLFQSPNRQESPTGLESGRARWSPAWCPDRARHAQAFEPVRSSSPSMDVECKGRRISLPSSVRRGSVKDCSCRSTKERFFNCET